MIKQSISCDICGSQKRQANHWFVAYETAGELRIGDWNSSHLLFPESKHLCGESCVHKLVGEFLANSVHALARVAETAETQEVARSKMAINSTGDADLSSHSLTSAARGLTRFGLHSTRAPERLRNYTCAGNRTS